MGTKKHSNHSVQNISCSCIDNFIAHHLISLSLVSWTNPLYIAKINLENGDGSDVIYELVIVLWEESHKKYNNQELHSEGQLRYSVRTYSSLWKVREPFSESLQHSNENGQYYSLIDAILFSFRLYLGGGPPQLRQPHPLNDCMATITRCNGGKRLMDELITTAVNTVYDHERLVGCTLICSHLAQYSLCT